MTSHSNAEQEEPMTGLPTTDGESDVEADAISDWEEDEEMRKKRLSTRYERGSKKPMKAPLTAPWGLLISDVDVEKLKVEVRARDMDDKWEVLIEDPDEDGNMAVHILRSWLQEEAYILYIAPKPSNDDGGSAMIQSITWEGNKSGLQYDVEQAKKEAVMVSRSHLHCEFKMLPYYPSTVFWQSSGYKRLEPEYSNLRKKALQ